MAFIGGGIFYGSNQTNHDGATVFWLCLIGLAFIAIGAFLWSNRKYELILQTTAGKITPLASRDKKLLDNILHQLQIAMSHENPSQNYSVTIADNIINSVVGSNVGGNIDLRHTR